MPYNLSQARSLINAKFATFGPDEKRLLLEILTNIDSIENEVAQKFAQKIHPQDDLDTILKNSADNIKDANSFCLYACQGYKRHIDELAAQHSNKKFKDLLTEISTHFDGVIAKAITNLNSYNQLQEQILDRSIYRACKALGGLFIPSMQYIDPLMGKQSIENNKWVTNRGECHGHVLQTSGEIQYLGQPQYHPVVKGNTQYHQTNHTKLSYLGLTFEYAKTLLKSAKKDDVQTFINNVLKKIKDTHTYLITMSRNNSSHSTRIRINPKTNIIEFYDPNYGTFFFNNKEAFAKFFVMLISNYRQSSSQYKQFKLLALSKQNELANSNIIKFSSANNQKNNDPICIELVDNFLQNADIQYSNGTLTENDKRIMRIACHDVIISMIDTIKDQNYLTDINQLVSKYTYIFTLKGKLSDELKSIYKALDKKSSSLGPVSKQETVVVAKEPNKSQVVISEPVIIKKPQHQKMTALQNTILDFLSKQTFALQFFTQKIKHFKVQLVTIENHLKKGAEAFCTNYTPEIGAAYLQQLLKMITSHKQFIKDHPLNSETELLISYLKAMEQSVTDFIKKHQKNSTDLNNDLNDADRMKNDKMKLQAILKEIKKSPKNYVLMKVSTLFIRLTKNKSDGDKSYKKQLKAIIAKDYENYQQLEAAVHELNQKMRFTGLSPLASKLDEFFINHLGFSDYKRGNDISDYYVQSPTSIMQKSP